MHSLLDSAGRRPEPPNWVVLRRLAKQLEDELRVPSRERSWSIFSPILEKRLPLKSIPKTRQSLGLNAADVAQPRYVQLTPRTPQAFCTRNESDLLIEINNQFEQVGPHW